MKKIIHVAAAVALTFSAGAASAACDDGEIVIKFSHVTNTDKHPKGIAATLLHGARQRRNGRCGLCRGLPELDPLQR